MDNIKTGELIRKLRTNLGYTQAKLADVLGVSDKAISKWENGRGCPDVALLPDIASALNVNVEALMSGDIKENDKAVGNMKNEKFYICPQCGNISVSTEGAKISCCGKDLIETKPVKAADSDKLSVEVIDNNYYVSSDHEMTKEHYISFIALLTSDTIILKRMYPEWNMEATIPRLSHGKLVYYCVRHGLMYQLV